MAGGRGAAGGHGGQREPVTRGWPGAGPEPVGVPGVARPLGALRRALFGTPVALPDALLARWPELGAARWRRGGLALRVGGWCLGRATVSGITLGRTVFLTDAIGFPVPLLLHEVAHVHQFASSRVFPLAYCWQSLRHGYARNRFERDADAFAARVLAERPVAPGGAPAPRAVDGRPADLRTGGP